MQRLAAIVVILLAGLSLLVSTQAYEVARPVNPTQVPVVSTELGALQVEAGANNAALYSMVSSPGGRLKLDMEQGPNGAGYGFDTNSTYTLEKIIKVTNTTGSAKNVSVTATGSTVTLQNVTGYINAAAAAVSQPFALQPGDSVQLNLSLKTGAVAPSTGMTITVTGN